MNIFICHAPSDARTAGKLALDLMKRGFEVWLDQPNPQGDPVEPEIRRADLLEGIRSSQLFIVIVSPTALTSPDLYEQVEYAVEKQRNIVVGLRQECHLTKRIEAHLKERTHFDLSRTGYDQGLTTLLTSLGADPTHIVNDIISELEVEEWMPGKWDIKFINPTAGLEGTAEFLFDRDGTTAGTVTLPVRDVIVTLRVRGSWQFLNDRFTIQGYSLLSMNIEQAILPSGMSYVLSVKVTKLERGHFEAVSSVGDTLIFEKVPMTQE